MCFCSGTQQQCADAYKRPAVMDFAALRVLQTPCNWRPSQQRSSFAIVVTELGAALGRREMKDMERAGAPFFQMLEYQNWIKRLQFE
eukprot:721023-Rhodomonas_salina.1